MHLEDLELGDLVFFLSPHLGIVEHTSIFLGTKNNVPYIIHATKEPYYSVMVTRLKNDDINSYHIIRPRNKRIATEAVAILLAWVEYQVPYTCDAKFNRLMGEAEKHFSFELKASAPAQMRFGTKSYAENYHQYIEMANSLPDVTPSISESGVGCAESITMAFNLACLILNASYREETQEWCLSSSVDEFLKTLSNPLPFDASNALSAGVFEYCAQHAEHWLNLGQLDLKNESSLREEDKEAWRVFKKTLQSRAQQLKESRKSPSPAEGRKRSRTYTDEGKCSCDLTDLIKFTALQVEQTTGSPDLSMHTSPLTLFFSPDKTKSSRSINRSPSLFFTPIPEPDDLDSLSMAFEKLSAYPT